VSIIEVGFICDWCECKISQKVQVPGPHREQVPKNPLHQLYIPAPDETTQMLCDDCNNKAVLQMKGLREKLRGSRKGVATELPMLECSIP
jgi:hypothetical protein